MDQTDNKKNGSGRNFACFSLANRCPTLGICGTVMSVLLLLYILILALGSHFKPYRLNPSGKNVSSQSNLAECNYILVTRTKSLSRCLSYFSTEFSSDSLSSTQIRGRSMFIYQMSTNFIKPHLWYIFFNKTFQVSTSY